MCLWGHVADVHVLTPAVTERVCMCECVLLTHHVLRCDVITESPSAYYNTVRCYDDVIMQVR